MASRDGAASIQGDMIRVTPLNIDGSIDTARPILTTNGFISASFGTEFEDGDEITEKAADGTICIQYKADDSLKGITFNLTLCTPDPEMAALIAGGKIICATDDVLDDDDNVVVHAGDVIGYSSPTIGASVGNPVAVEIWSKAIVKGKPASGTPYWHWAFPYVRVRYEGDREFTNGALANEYSGTGVGNEALVAEGLNPDTAGDDFVTYKEALANPFSYVRATGKPDISLGAWSGGAGGSGEWTKTASNSIGCVAGAAPATLTTVAPATGAAAGGTATVLTGTGFTGATGVTFGGTAGSTFSVVNATTINVTTPPHAAGAVTVIVQHPSGNASKPTGFTYT
jgi:IPT/TIG domain